MNFKGFTKMDFLYKKLTRPELDILKDYILKKIDSTNQEWMNGRRCPMCGRPKEYDPLCDVCDKCLENE